MYSDEELNSAVAAGALSADAAAALRAHVAVLRQQAVVEDEHFRLISGFNDIFVVIASLLLLASVAWIGASVQNWVGALAVCAAAWLLAEFFVRKRHMALPAIVLLAAFVGGAFYACRLFFGGNPNGLAIGGAVAAVAALLHWLRFRVPITVAAGVAALLGGAIGVLASVVPDAHRWVSTALFVGGATSFVLALRWDASDARRQTGRSDVAFWLHLLAAPLMVHPIFTGIGLFAGGAGVLQTLLIVLMYVGIGLVSLAIDRRALMVSALGYVLYAFATLFQQFGLVSLSFALTALVIGCALLLLSAFWQKSRAFAVRRLPHGIQARLAPIR